MREAEPTQVNLDLYRVFRRVAKSGSISSAARQLYLTKPAVTQAVKRLEEQLGVTLFHRTSRGTRLTLKGVRFTMQTRPTDLSRRGA